jgi:hypothetical protein
MENSNQWTAKLGRVTRSGFLELGSVAASAWSASSVIAAHGDADALLQELRLAAAHAVGFLNACTCTNGLHSAALIVKA